MHKHMQMRTRAYLPYLYVDEDALKVLRLEKPFKRFHKVLQKCEGRCERARCWKYVTEVLPSCAHLNHSFQCLRVLFLRLSDLLQAAFSFVHTTFLLLQQDFLIFFFARS